MQQSALVFLVRVERDTNDDLSASFGSCPTLPPNYTEETRIRRMLERDLRETFPQMPHELKSVRIVHETLTVAYVEIEQPIMAMNSVIGYVEDADYERDGRIATLEIYTGFNHPKRLGGKVRAARVVDLYASGGGVLPPHEIDWMGAYRKWYQALPASVFEDTRLKTV